MSNYTMDDFRDEMKRRGVYERDNRVLTQKEREAQRPKRDVSARVVEEALADLEGMSIKRLAWAFGCAKTDSETEAMLYRALVRKVERILDARKAGG